MEPYTFAGRQAMVRQGMRQRSVGPGRVAARAREGIRLAVRPLLDGLPTCPKGAGPTVESCSPRLIASRVEARRRPSGFGRVSGRRASRPTLLLEPPSSLDEKPRSAGIAAKLFGRVGLSAEAAEARTLFDCHIWP